MFLILILVIVISLTIYLFNLYNYQIKLLNEYKRSKSAVDVYLQQRFQLIPNLEKVVKKYTEYENENLEKIVKLREQYNKEKNFKNAEKIEEEYEQILLRIEKYPELKSDKLFNELSKNLVILENQIQAARRAYNFDTTKYNSFIQEFPKNIIAKIFKWEKKELFYAEKDAQKSPVV